MTHEDKQWIAALVEQAEGRIMARVECVETSLLTEFHKWASPLEMRIRTHSAALRAVDLEVEAGGDRVTKLEDNGPGVARRRES